MKIPKLFVLIILMTRFRTAELIKPATFLFSSVITVNNSTFLIPTVQSHLQQTVEFESSIQIILINQATDNSLSICRAYQRKYPHNIFLTESISDCPILGKYIVFLNNGDRWDRSAFRILTSFTDHGDCLIPRRICSPILHDLDTSRDAISCNNGLNKLNGIIFTKSFIPKLYRNATFDSKAFYVNDDLFFYNICL